MKLIVALAVVVAIVYADDSCSENGKLLSSAVNCEDRIPSETCKLMFFPASDLKVGEDVSLRPSKCSVTLGESSGIPTMRKAAINNCARTCGFCCLAK